MENEADKLEKLRETLTVSVKEAINKWEQGSGLRFKSGTVAKLSQGQFNFTFEYDTPTEVPRGT